jgi:uncharacterized DUF497 family protein
VKFAWDERKRSENLRKHGVDFADVHAFFAGTFTIEDRRFAYREQRFITLGMVQDTVLVCAHTESGDTIRVISMRKAARNEQTIYFENL